MVLMRSLHAPYKRHLHVFIVRVVVFSRLVQVSVVGLSLVIRAGYKDS